MPTPTTDEPGFTVRPVDKNGQPTNNPNETWYHPVTGRPLQKGITQVLRENELLRTPTASQGEGGALGEEEARKRGNTVGIRDQAMDLALADGHKVSRVEMMPTPIESDWKNGKSSEGFGLNHSETAKLFPTPNTMDYLPARTPEQKAANKGKGGYANVRETVVNELPTTNWGKFEPAIKRWEQVIGRKAPAPTKPDGKNGAHRLSSRFTEWMMGLPEGWITDVGLTRNEELKACGNGVVPQQAEMALRILLDDLLLIERGVGQVNLPTPTVMDKMDGSVFRAVAIENLAKGKNRGINLNNLVESGLTKWQEGDTFDIIDGKAVKRGTDATD